MKSNVLVVRFKFRCSILISGKIIKEMPGSVASGTHCSYFETVEEFKYLGNILFKLNFHSVIN